MSEKVSQTVIGVLGGIGFFLISTGHPVGFVLTLATEPFWFISTKRNRQWGMFFLAFLYTVSCLIGIDRGYWNGSHLHYIGL